MSLKPGVPKGKPDKKKTQPKPRDKNHIPNLIYVALHVLFCEIHVKE